MMLQYLDWIFPDIAQCFFPITMKQERRWRWPGLGTAVWCLLLEAMCFLTASSLLVFLTAFWGYRVAMGLVCDSVIPGLPSAWRSKKGELFDVTKLDAKKGQVTPKTIQGFISRSEPVVIKNLPKGTFAELAHGGKYAPPLSKAMTKRGTEQAVVTTISLYPRSLGKFGRWIRKHVQSPVAYMFRLSGNYVSTAAHIDGFTNNVYYLARGRKRVWVCPRQYTHLLRFLPQLNSEFILGTGRKDSNRQKWIQSVPGVWAFELEQGDLLIFSNAGCVHQFENITKDPEAFSLRVPTINVSPVMAKHWIFNWEQARSYINVVVPTMSSLWRSGKEVEIEPVEEAYVRQMFR